MMQFTLLMTLEMKKRRPTNLGKGSTIYALESISGFRNQAPEGNTSRRRDVRQQSRSFAR